MKFPFLHKFCHRKNLALLYKFCHFSPDYDVLRIISHNEIFFSSPGKFNDPFDCTIPIDYATGPTKIIFKYWFEMAKDENPECSDTELKKMTEECIGNLKNQERQLRLRKNSAEFCSNHIGICSLTASYTNLIMWANYADKHRGFVVGFYSKKLVKMCRENSPENDPNKTMLIENVNYTQDYPYINAYTHTGLERYKLQVLSKSEDWTNEEEYRIVFTDGVGKSTQFPPGTISCVYLGCRISFENKELILKAISEKDYKIPVFQASTSDSHYELKFERIH